MCAGFVFLLCPCNIQIIWFSELVPITVARKHLKVWKGKHTISWANIKCLLVCVLKPVTLSDLSIVLFEVPLRKGLQGSACHCWKIPESPCWVSLFNHPPVFNISSVVGYLPKWLLDSFSFGTWLSYALVSHITLLSQMQLVQWDGTYFILSPLFYVL